MKLAKLSLAAMMVAGLASSSFAADTLADAFKNGKVNGELKAYYFSNNGDHDSDDTSREDIFTTGLLLSYKTAPLYGFAANFTFQGSSSPFSDNDGEARYQGNMYGPGAVLSEAYLSYTLGKTTALVGRMFLDTPLVATSGSRVVKDAFEGAAVINTDLPNTTLIAGYVQKYQNRTNGEGDIGEFTRTFATGSSASPELEHGAYTIAAINKSIPGLTLTAAYAYADSYLEIEDNTNTMVMAIDGAVHIGYAEAVYAGKAGNIGYTLAAQDYYNKFDKVINGADDSINIYALKAGMSISGINAYVAFSQSSKDAVPGEAVISGLGNGADLLYTTPVIGSAPYYTNTQGYAVDLNYDVTAAANIGTRYVLVDQDSYTDVLGDNEESAKVSYTAVYGSYKFDGALKGFKVSAEYEKVGKDVDSNDLWVKANYKF